MSIAASEALKLFKLVKISGARFFEDIAPEKYLECEVKYKLRGNQFYPKLMRSSNIDSSSNSLKLIYENEREIDFHFTSDEIGDRYKVRLRVHSGNRRPVLIIKQALPFSPIYQDGKYFHLNKLYWSKIDGKISASDVIRVSGLSVLRKSKRNRRLYIDGSRVLTLDWNASEGLSAEVGFTAKVDRFDYVPAFVRDQFVDIVHLVRNLGLRDEDSVV